MGLIMRAMKRYWNQNLSSIRQKRNDIKFIVASGNPDYTASTFDVQTVDWLDINEIINAIGMSDLVIIGGGGLFSDYWGDVVTLLTSEGRGISYYSNFAIIADLLGKPFMTYAVGIGLLTEDGKQITNFSLRHAEKITVRDFKSAQVAADIGLPRNKIITTAKSVFLLEPDVEGGLDIVKNCGIPNVEAPLLLVSVRPWDVDINEEIWQSEFASAIDTWLEEKDGYAVFVPFQVLSQEGFRDDIAVTDYTIEKMKQKGTAPLFYDGIKPKRYGRSLC